MQGSKRFVRAPFLWSCFENGKGENGKCHLFCLLEITLASTCWTGPLNRNSEQRGPNLHVTLDLQQSCFQQRQTQALSQGLMITVVLEGINFIDYRTRTYTHTQTHNTRGVYKRQVETRESRKQLFKVSSHWPSVMLVLSVGICSDPSCSGSITVFRLE